MAGPKGHIRIVDNFIVDAQRLSIYKANGDAVTIIGNYIREHRTGALQGGQTGLGRQRTAVNVARVEDIFVQGNKIENVQDGAIVRNHYSFARGGRLWCPVKERFSPTTRGGVMS